MTEALINSLAEYSVIFILLLAAILWLNREKKQQIEELTKLKDKQIDDLIAEKNKLYQQLTEAHAYEREMDRENITALNGLTNVMDKLLTDGKQLNVELIRSLKEQSDRVIERITSHIDMRK